LAALIPSTSAFLSLLSNRGIKGNFANQRPGPSLFSFLSIRISAPYSCLQEFKKFLVLATECDVPASFSSPWKKGSPWRDIVEFSFPSDTSKYSFARERFDLCADVLSRLFSLDIIFFFASLLFFSHGPSFQRDCPFSLPVRERLFLAAISAGGISFHWTILREFFS